MYIQWKLLHSVSLYIEQHSTQYTPHPKVQSNEPGTYMYIWHQQTTHIVHSPVSLTMGTYSTLETLAICTCRYIVGEFHRLSQRNRTSVGRLESLSFKDLKIIIIIIMITIIQKGSFSKEVLAVYIYTFTCKCLPAVVFVARMITLPGLTNHITAFLLETETGATHSHLIEKTSEKH